MADEETAFVEVVPDFSGFRRSANSEMSDILGTAGAVGGGVAGTKMNAGIIGSVSKLAGPLLAAFAALGIGRIIGEAIGTGINYALDGIDLASDLSETKSAITQVFGAAAKDIEAFADTANTALGQTEQQALSAAQTFGVFAQSAGLTDKPLSDFSTGLVSLATDLASFYNTDPQSAIDAIGAGLRGESEPLRQYGVLLDDATLKQSAMTLGIYDGSGSLTQQQRILAAQAEIFKQTGIAQGDYARTSDGLAGQQKELAASFQEAQTALGEALLPAMTSLVTLANDELVPILSDVIEQVGPELAQALADSAPSFTELALALAPLLPQLVELATELLPLMVQGLILATPFLIDAASNTTYWYASLNDLFGLITGDKSIDEFVDGVTNAGGSIAQVTRDTANGLISMLSGFGEFAAGVMNITIDAINGTNKALAAAINSVSGITGVTATYVAVPRIQLQSAQQKATKYQLAEGAFFGARPGGYSATIGEGKWDEAVLPLSPAVFSQLAEGIAAQSKQQGGGIRDVIIQNDDPYFILSKLEQKMNGRLATS